MILQALEETGVFIGTLQGTKGLEADVVIIPELEEISSSTGKRQLLYVGMTRAMYSLILTGSGNNEFISNLRAIFDIRQFDYEVIQEMRSGERCFLCKETKNTGVDKPLCYSCWKRLINQEICHYCGASLNIDIKEEVIQELEESRVILFSCQQCLNEVHNHCLLCGTTISSKLGKPLCNNCFSTLRPAWDLASTKFFSKDLS